MNYSKSEQFLNAKKGLPPEISPFLYKHVSQYRKEGLEQEMLSGKFREAGDTGQGLTKNGLTTAGLIYKAKTAALSGESGDNWRGSGNTVKQLPEVYSPLWLNSNLNFPRDRATVNAWCRSYFALNPIVRNAISLHSTYPISKLTIKCKNAKHQQFFETMAEEIGLMNLCVQVAQEYWTLGEAFVYGELDERAGKWSRLLIQNPDYMVVKRSVVAGEPIISLRPDENLRRICMGNKPSDIQQREQLDRSIIEHVKKGENIPLSNFYVSHLANKISPYEVRGTSLITGIFKNLMLMDRIRESKFAQTDDMINPLRIFKVGGGVSAYQPTPADLEGWRHVIEDASSDKNFKLITHDGFTVETVGAGTGIYDTGADITQLIKEMYIGLMVPSVLMDGGGDITYANGGVALDALKSRYFSFRNYLTDWLRRKVFAPIAKINNFYEVVDGKKILQVPDIDWNHMSLFDTNDYIAQLVTLATASPSPKGSVQTLYKSLGLEYEDEQRKMRREAIDAAILAKEVASLQTMSLTDLRALTDESEIKESKEAPLPGETQAPVPGESMGGLGGISAPPNPGPTPPTFSPIQAPPK